MEEIKLDENGQVVDKDQWPEARWRFDSLPSGSIAFNEVKILCGLGALPSGKLSTDIVGDWKPIPPENTARLDVASVRGADGVYILRTAQAVEESQRMSGRPYTLAISNWIVACKRSGIGVYAMSFHDQSGTPVDSFVLTLDSVTLTKPSETKPIPRFVYAALCESTNSSQDASVGPTAPKSTPEKSALGKSGTGFFVSRDGQILTNSHVVNGCKSIRVRYPDRGVEGASMLVEDKKNDLALLVANRRPAAVAIFRDSPVLLGELIMSIGFPLTGVLSSEAIMSAGNVSATAGIGDDISQLQISAPVQPGNSGGPVLDKSGLVVGVVVSKLDAINVAKVIGDIPQNVNFGIKGDVARIFLNAYGVSYFERTDRKVD